MNGSEKTLGFRFDYPCRRRGAFGGQNWPFECRLNRIVRAWVLDVTIGFDSSSSLNPRCLQHNRNTWKPASGAGSRKGVEVRVLSSALRSGQGITETVIPFFVFPGFRPFSKHLCGEAVVAFLVVTRTLHVKNAKEAAKICSAS